MQVGSICEVASGRRPKRKRGTFSDAKKQGSCIVVKVALAQTKRRYYDEHTDGE